MTEETEIKPNIMLTRKEDQELRIYFFIGKRNVFDVNMPMSPAQADQTIIYVWEFKLEDAFEKAKIEAQPGNYNLTFTGQKPTVREFLHKLELESVALQIVSEPKPPQEIKIAKEEIPPAPLPAMTPRQMSFEQFRAGLLFFANESGVIYQQEDDREVLQKIISGLKYEG
jgi:hypothetical protein